MPILDLLRRRRPEPTEAYLDLRSMVFELQPDVAGMAPTPELPRVWGAIVDWAVGDGFATFVAISDGTASMYLSSGGGVIGGGERPAIARAATRLVATVERELDAMAPAAAPVPPQPGVVMYWALTFDGLRSASHAASGPPHDDPSLEALGSAFQEYVRQFRLFEEERR